jgi:hypothetical protein
MIEINVNINQGYPKIFIKDSISEPYCDDDVYDDTSVSTGVNQINILCQPVWENINKLFIRINDSIDSFDDLNYHDSYELEIPSGVVVVQDDITAVGENDNTYVALECQRNSVIVKVFLDDFDNPSSIGLSFYTKGRP